MHVNLCIIMYYHHYQSLSYIMITIIIHFYSPVIHAIQSQKQMGTSTHGNMVAPAVVRYLWNAATVWGSPRLEWLMSPIAAPQNQLIQRTEYCLLPNLQSRNTKDEQQSVTTCHSWLSHDVGLTSWTTGWCLKHDPTWPRHWRGVFQCQAETPTAGHGKIFANCFLESCGFFAENFSTGRKMTWGAVHLQLWYNCVVRVWLWHVQVYIVTVVQYHLQLVKPERPTCLDIPRWSNSVCPCPLDHGQKGVTKRQPDGYAYN